MSEKFIGSRSFIGLKASIVENDPDMRVACKQCEGGESNSYFKLYIGNNPNAICECSKHPAGGIVFIFASHIKEIGNYLPTIYGLKT